MASYFDKWKRGIEEQDWELVAEAYKDITGISIDLPSPKYTERDEEEYEDEPIPQKPGKFAKKPVTNATGKKPKKVPVHVEEGNLFVDTGKDAKNLLQKPKDKKQWEKPQGRSGPKMVNVKCISCRTPAFIRESLLPVSVDERERKVYGEYVCGNCVSKQKGN